MSRDQELKRLYALQEETAKKLTVCKEKIILHSLGKDLWYDPRVILRSKSFLIPLFLQLFFQLLLSNKSLGQRFLDGVAGTVFMWAIIAASIYAVKTDCGDSSLRDVLKRQENKTIHSLELIQEEINRLEREKLTSMQGALQDTINEERRVRHALTKEKRELDLVSKRIIEERAEWETHKKRNAEEKSAGERELVAYRASIAALKEEREALLSEKAELERSLQHLEGEYMARTEGTVSATGERRERILRTEGTRAMKEVSESAMREVAGVARAALTSNETTSRIAMNTTAELAREGLATQERLVETHAHATGIFAHGLVSATAGAYRLADRVITEAAVRDADAAEERLRITEASLGAVSQLNAQHLIARDREAMRAIQDRRDERAAGAAALNNSQGTVARIATGVIGGAARITTGVVAGGFRAVAGVARMAIAANAYGRDSSDSDDDSSHNAEALVHRR